MKETVEFDPSTVRVSESGLVQPTETDVTPGKRLAEALGRALRETDPAKRAGAVKAFGRIFDDALEDVRGEIPAELDDLI